MLVFVQQRFLKIAERHLNEAKAWIEIAKIYNDKYAFWAVKIANRKADEHMQMARYWHMACNNLHYKPGTWAYKF